MLAAFAARLDADEPLDNLEVGERPEPDAPDGWVTVDVRAASLNHHDLFALQGVALKADRVPMILGTDAAGVDPDGNEVVVHAVISDPDWRDDETLDPSRTLLSELHQGTLAEKVAVPRRNLVPKPAGLSFAQAASVPTAWLTAYRMLFTRGACKPGETVLVQGAGGGLATAAIALGAAAGLRVWATSRDEKKRNRAVELGADQAFESGARLPERVDCVIESVGEATWEHSIKSLRPGGRLVVSGATSGAQAVTDLRRVFFLQLDVVGSTMGTRDELEHMLAFMAARDVMPIIDRTLSLSEAADGLRAMAAGDLFGKVVLEP
ncbi:MAG: zinc-binding dehydrogenase [Solirubrobacteraceae bacterium]